MKIVIFGASGMVGGGVLNVCIKDPSVQRIVSVGRAPLKKQHAKLHHLVLPSLFDLGLIADQLVGLDACFFCLGASSAGMTEEQYRHLTYDLTVSVANALLELNPAMTFVYVSGRGTDSTEQGGTMWSRVKGATENALLAMPFKSTFMLRPGIILPMHGIKSKTRSYWLFYELAGPLLRLIYRLQPRSMTTTDKLGQAMLNLVRHGASQTILDDAAINAAAQPRST